MSAAQPEAGSASSDEVLVSVEGSVLTVTFNRPSRHNAMTWNMYDGLVEACERADGDDRIRSMVLTGAGEKAFVAGTDIGQFADFGGGEDGVAYEERVGATLARLAQVTKPTIAAVRGHCVGAGIALAATCDLRVATPSARFGVPIAKTLGNCLSAGTQALLIHHLGPSRTMDLLLTARMLGAEQAATAGFVNRFVAEDELDSATRALTERLADHAPLTIWAAKATTRRIPSLACRTTATSWRSSTTVRISGRGWPASPPGGVRTGAGADIKGRTPTGWARFRFGQRAVGDAP